MFGGDKSEEELKFVIVVRTLIHSVLEQKSLLIWQSIFYFCIFRMANEHSCSLSG